MTLHPKVLKVIDNYRGDIPRSKFISRIIEYTSEHYKDYSQWYSNKATFIDRAGADNPDE